MKAIKREYREPVITVEMRLTELENLRLIIGALSYNQVREALKTVGYKLSGNAPMEQVLEGLHRELKDIVEDAKKEL
jgi:hypothetical protein